MDINYYLGEGKFTKRDEIVKTALKEALSLEGRITHFGKISLWLSKNISVNKEESKEEVEEKIKNFRKRTASQVIKSRKSNGCSDYGIVFLALAREAGIPSIYVETIEKSNLDNPIKFIDGHIFTEIYIDKSWKIYDPLKGFQKEYSLCGRKYIPISKGLDFSDLSLKGKKVILNRFDKIREARDNFPHPDSY